MTCASPTTSKPPGAIAIAVAEPRPLSLEAWAGRRNLSGKYLALVAKTLEEAKTGTGYLQQLGARWDALPAPAHAAEVPQELRGLERFIAFGARLGLAKAASRR